MYAVEFNAKINNGKIYIPQQYQDKFNSDVKVILLKTEIDDISHKIEGIKTAKGFGVLSHRANPNLWEQEENSWERFVTESYDNN